MVEPIEISVTQADIDAGRRANCLFCPIALAAQRVYGHGVSVGIWCLYFVNRQEQLALPIEASRFITRFDQRKPVTPFTFTPLRPR